MAAAVFTAQEFTDMVSLVAALDPAKYVHPAAKALIFKCIEVKDGNYDRARVVS